MGGGSQVNLHTAVDAPPGAKLGLEQHSAELMTGTFTPDLYGSPNLTGQLVQPFGRQLRQR